jgi:hypothetical protein
MKENTVHRVKEEARRSYILASSLPYKPVFDKYSAGKGEEGASRMRDCV